MLAMTNIANIRLAKPFSVPKAIAIDRCLFGVTRICSATKIVVKIATPHHNTQLCGRRSANATSVIILTQWRAILMYKEVATEKVEGME